MAQPSFQIDDQVEQWVENRLIAGQAKSIWYRYAVETAMIVDPVIDDVLERYQYDKRQELIEAAVIKEVQRRKDDVDGGSNH